MARREVTDPEEWDDITFCSDEYEEVTGEQIEGKRRWMTQYSQIIRHKESGRYYRLEWEEGNTEYQDMGFADTSHFIVEVEPVEVTTIEYREVK